MQRWHLYGLILLLFIAGAWYRSCMLGEAYREHLSYTLLDRNAHVLVIEKSIHDEFVLAGPLDIETEQLLLEQEDQWYYYHPGIHPVHLARAAYQFFRHGASAGGSTITQQLAKILAHNEYARTLPNKVVEIYDSVVLTLFFSKKEVLTMYAGSVYMGNSVRGFNAAALTYYGTELTNLTHEQKKSLVASIPAPTKYNPAARKITSITRPYQLALYPELDPLITLCKEANKYTTNKICTTTLDKQLQDTTRQMLRKKVEQLAYAGVTSGAVIIVNTDASVLAVVGSPYPTSTIGGASIDMTREARPIGSTIKPLIYVEAFRKGLRPYSYIDDREYSFTTESGSPLYPKNYDGVYHGLVTVQHALSNSLNVPAVKALEYVGLPRMYAFLQGDLGLVPVSPLESYSYGIALGGLETTPLKLAEMLLIFPREGLYAPLRFFTSDTSPSRRVARIEDTRLVTSILSDTYSRVDQFGLTALTLPFDNYAVKTGTSRDYHDSWTVGYTPERLVLTWLGNPENKPLRAISGGQGAGSLWKDIMLLVHNDPSCTDMCDGPTSTQSFSKSGLIPHPRDGQSTYTLETDTTTAPDIVDASLILFPHNGDVFSRASSIPIRTRVPVDIFVNGERVLNSFIPQSVGVTTIHSDRPDGTTEKIHVIIK